MLPFLTMSDLKHMKKESDGREGRSDDEWGARKPKETQGNLRKRERMRE